jgi:hypothetical protein
MILAFLEGFLEGLALFLAVVLDADVHDTFDGAALAALAWFAGWLIHSNKFNLKIMEQESFLYPKSQEAYHKNLMTLAAQVEKLTDALRRQKSQDVDVN